MNFWIWGYRGDLWIELQAPVIKLRFETQMPVAVVEFFSQTGHSAFFPFDKNALWSIRCDDTDLPIEQGKFSVFSRQHWKSIHFWLRNLTGSFFAWKFQWNLSLTSSCLGTSIGRHGSASWASGMFGLYKGILAQYSSNKTGTQCINHKCSRSSSLVLTKMARIRTKVRLNYQLPVFFSVPRI